MAEPSSSSCGSSRRRYKRYIAPLRRMYAANMSAFLMVGLLGLAVWEAASFGLYGGAVGSYDGATGGHQHGRSLLAVNSSGDDDVDVLNTCAYEEDNLPGLWIFFYIVVIYNIFLGIAILCDDHFVPLLEAITEVLDLSEDVAGATFMAAGMLLQSPSILPSLFMLPCLFPPPLPSPLYTRHSKAPRVLFYAPPQWCKNTQAHTRTWMRVQVGVGCTALGRQTCVPALPASHGAPADLT